MKKIIYPIQKISGTISVPGDKSISHRALMLGSIAYGDTIIHNLSPGVDVSSTQKCLIQLGIDIKKIGKKVSVRGKGLYGFKPSKKNLDAGNSGTTLRLLSGLLSAQNFTTMITGDTSLQKRPMNRIIRPLNQMGIQIQSKNGRAPLIIEGHKPNAIRYESPVASAQVKSAILLAGLYANGLTTVQEPALSRDHTERMLNCFGVEVQQHELKTSLSGPSTLKATPIDVPGDISSASFFMIASILLQDSHLILKNVGINPTRTGLLDILKRMGVNFTQLNSRIMNQEPRADLSVQSSSLQSIQIQRNWIPKVIDEIPILAIAATQANGETVIQHAKELRVKETDRISAITTNLKKMKIQLNEFDDGFSIKGPQTLHGAVINSYGDHRIAMAFTVAGLIAQGQTTILDAECVEISYPGFYNDLERISHAE